MNCPDCFKDGRSLRDQLLQTITDAKKFAQEGNRKVAIIQEGQQFRYEAFTDGIPAGTIEVILPGR